MSPNSYRKGGSGIVLHYHIATTQVGLLLVEGTEKGLSTVFLGDAEAELEHDLPEEYPRAEFVKSEMDFVHNWIETVTAHLVARESETALFKLPFDVQSTSFQAKVWAALRDIPRGETRSYTQVAKQLGSPNAVRAVASACAANKVAMVIPCHRVVRSDGSLSGYRWGVDRKKLLLEWENELS